MFPFDNPIEFALGAIRRSIPRFILSALAVVAGLFVITVFAVGIFISARQAYAVDAPPGVPYSVSGTCHIGSTTMEGTQSYFEVTSFDGPLESAYPVGRFECINHTAAAPEDVDATYEGTLSAFNVEEGWAEYDIVITPPDATDGVTSNAWGLIGYQRVGGKVRIGWNYYGGVVVAKTDKQYGDPFPQGAASFEGTAFSIVSENDNAVVVDGQRFEKGDVVKTITAELQDVGGYRAQTGNDCLPFGTYRIYECSFGEGYDCEENHRWSRTFQVSGNGEMTLLVDGGDAAANQVVRGDFAFDKVDGLTGRALGNVAFMVTSLTTGEHHVIVTDASGHASTSSSRRLHSANTNANDDAVTILPDGAYEIDESLINADAGIWFNGRADASCAVNDQLGALPYDSYHVEEIRCAANEGYDLVAFRVKIACDGCEFNMGPIGDNAERAIGTVLAAIDGSKTITVGGTVKLVDTVTYQNLCPAQTYYLHGTLHRLNEAGEDQGIIADVTISFTPEATSGTVDVEFELDTTGLAGARVVAFEELLDDGQHVISAHEDPTSEEQTVIFVAAPKAPEPEPESKPPADKPQSSNLPQTGDELPKSLPFIAYSAVAATGIVLSALSVRRLQRKDERRR